MGNQIPSFQFIEEQHRKHKRHETIFINVLNNKLLKYDILCVKGPITSQII